MDFLCAALDGGVTISSILADRLRIHCQKIFINILAYLPLNGYQILVVDDQYACASISQSCVNARPLIVNCSKANNNLELVECEAPMKAALYSVSNDLVGALFVELLLLIFSAFFLITSKSNVTLVKRWECSDNYAKLFLLYLALLMQIVYQQRS